MEWDDLDLAHGRPSELAFWYTIELGGKRYKGTNHNLTEKGWRREHAKAVCGAWLGLFNFMAARGQAFEQGFAAGRYDALKSDT